MGAYGAQPLQRIKRRSLSSVFRSVNNLGGVCQILHPFLGEGSLESVPGQVFHGGLILGKYPLTAEDLDSE